jgi:hypothetical protein
MEIVIQASQQIPQTIVQLSNKLLTKVSTAISITNRTSLILASLWPSLVSATSSATLEIQPTSPLKASFLRSINEVL